ncbi:hypothetical protein NDU88_003217 [Pleurodeles waltl]|uniref:Uncharacterized protein n=1 Tax=Pleurodeles waltl TaxID=8319 RepID=A0AAV7RHX8_PLEWA|nr:hypothetical protein NDU88_003217 [Pleurodeles waltl]
MCGGRILDCHPLPREGEPDLTIGWGSEGPLRHRCDVAPSSASTRLSSAAARSLSPLPPAKAFYARAQLQGRAPALSAAIPHSLRGAVPGSSNPAPLLPIGSDRPVPCSLPCCSPGRVYDSGSINRPGRSR